LRDLLRDLNELRDQDGGPSNSMSDVHDLTGKIGDCEKSNVTITLMAFCLCSDLFGRKSHSGFLDWISCYVVEEYRSYPLLFLCHSRQRTTVFYHILDYARKHYAYRTLIVLGYCVLSVGRWKFIFIILILQYFNYHLTIVIYIFSVYLVISHLYYFS